MRHGNRLALGTVPAAALSLLLLHPAAAVAQICRGTADISTQSRLQGGTVLEFAEVRRLTATGDHRSFAGILSAGSDRYFAEAQTGFTFAEPDFRTFDTHFLVAGQFGVDKRRRVIICPGFTFGTSSGTDIAGINGWNLSTRSIGGGVAGGAVVWETSTIKLIPAVSAILERVRLRLGSEANRFTASDNLAFVDLGVGLVLHRRFTLKPSFIIPLVDFQGADVGKSVRLTFTASSQ